MISHSQHQDGDLYPGDSIFPGRPVRPVPLPPENVPARGELSAALKLALRELMAENGGTPVPASAGPPPRRRAAERNFRNTGGTAPGRSSFRPTFGVRSVEVPASGAFTAGSGSCHVPVRARDAVPIFMAGLGAIADMPEEKRCVPGRITACIGSAVAVLMASFTLVAFRSGTSPAVARVQQPTAVEAAYGNGLEQMEAAVRAFCNASTPEEKAATIRGGGSMLPALREWYAAHPDEAPGFHLDNAVNLPDGRGFVMVRGVNDAGRPVQTLVQETPGGGWLVDWRSCTGAGDMAWEPWLQQRPAQPVTQRVVATLDQIYTAPFDAEKYLCLKISDAADTAGAWAYIERASPGGQELTALLTPPPGGPPVRNRLRFTGVFSFPENAAAGSAACVQLLSLTSKTWRDDTPEAGARLVAAHTAARP